LEEIAPLHPAMAVFVEEIDDLMLFRTCLHGWDSCIKAPGFGRSVRRGI